MKRHLPFTMAIAAIAIACETTNESARQSVSNADPASRARDGSADGSSTGDRRSPGQDRGKDATPPTVVTTETLEVAGQTRSFVLAVPQSYSAGTQYPLVLVLHGDGGDGASMRSAFPFENASAEAAIVAYPTGTLGWNLYDPAGSNADFSFLTALVESLEARFSIDPARVFGTGFSSGAFMVNQIGCRKPSLFRAIAAHSGGAPSEPRDPSASRWDNNYTRCAGQTIGSGPAVMVVHGTADAEVDYDSGAFAAMYWAYVNGCAPTQGAATPPSPCLPYDTCPAGKPVVFCPIDDLGHALWSNAMSATWQFFRGL